MYNGIGLQTPRGSGTNGHVQRNWAFVRPGKKDNVAYKTEEDISKLEASLNRQPNRAILDHERKRKIEVKCAEFEEILEKQGYDAETIQSKIESYRAKLLGQGKAELPKDEFGRIAVRETHQVAEAQQEKNAKLREAFGISEYFVEGTSFDPDRKAKEELAKSAALQEDIAKETAEKEKGRKYALVRTPSPEKDVQKPKKDSSEKKKKKRKHRDTSSSPDRKKEKKKKSKKHKKERSKKKKSKKRKEKVSDSDCSVESDSDKDSIDSNDEKKRKKTKKEKKKKEKKRRERSTSAESRSSARLDRTKSSQKKTKEKDSSSKKSGDNENRNRYKDEKQKKFKGEEQSVHIELARNNPFSNKTSNSGRNSRRSQSLNTKRKHSLSPSYRNTDSMPSQKRRPRSRSRKDKSRRNDSRSPLEEAQKNRKKQGEGEKGLKPQNMSHTPEKVLKRKVEAPRSSIMERSCSRTREQRRRTPEERRLSISRTSTSNWQSQKRLSSKDRSLSPETNETKRTKRSYRDSRSKSHSIDKQRNARKSSVTKERSPKRFERQQRSIEKRAFSGSPSSKRERVNPFRTGNNRRMQNDHASISPRGDRQRNSPFSSNKRYGYRGRRRSYSRSPSRNNRYSPSIRRRRTPSREGSRDRQSSRPRTKSPKMYKPSRQEDSHLCREYSSSRTEATSHHYKRETSQENWRDRKRSESKSSSPKNDRSFRDDEQIGDLRLSKKEQSIKQDQLPRSPHKEEIRTKIPSKSRSPTPRREDFLKSPIQKSSAANNSTILQNEAQPSDKSPLQVTIQQDKKPRSNSSSSESSDLSYSPARRDPERYRALLEQVKKETKGKDALKSPKKRTLVEKSSSKRNRSKSKDIRRSQNIHPQPRVHLHSNESDGSDGNESANEETRNRNVEKFIEAIVNEKKDENQKYLQKDMEMLEALKSGIAAKAKEKIKTIEKMATEINEPAPIAQTTLLPLNETNLVEAIVAKVANSTAVAAVAAAVAAEKKAPRSRSQSKNKIGQRRSRSGSRSSFTSTSSSSTGSSRSRSRSSGSSRSSRSSRSRSSSSATSGAHSRSRSRSATRSPSIPRRRGSPSFLDRRRITSARKRPIPYHRPTPSSLSSGGSSYGSRCSSPRSYHSPSKSCSPSNAF